MICFNQALALSMYDPLKVIFERVFQLLLQARGFNKYLVKP